MAKKDSMPLKKHISQRLCDSFPLGICAGMPPGQKTNSARLPHPLLHRSHPNHLWLILKFRFR